MKINRFEENLRKKLESIQPEFQEKDWQRMQSYMRQHAAPTFWQTHGPWIGYAAAASTAVLTTVLYFHQSHQNEKLRKEITSLKKTVEQQQMAPPTVTIQRDTVYVAGKEKAAEPDKALFEQKWRELYPTRPQAPSTPLPQDQELATSPALAEEKPAAPRVEPVGKPAVVTPDAATEAADRPQEPTNRQEPPPVLAQQSTGLQEKQSNNQENLTQRRIDLGTSRNSESVAPGRESVHPTNIATDQRVEIQGVEELPARPLAMRTPLARKLYRRMPPAQKDKSTLASVPPTTQATQPTAQPQPVEAQKPERILPDLPVPYRIGLGQQWEAKARATSLWSEILLSRHWSITTGLNWQKHQEERYVNERIFHDKKRQDFRAMHGRRIPPSFEVLNITTRTTLLQLPVGVNFRGELGRNFAYLAGAGTTINLRAKQEISFDLRIPTQQIDHWSERVLPRPPAFTNVVLSAGLEKRWDPIVLQAETYFIARNDARPYLPDNESLGIRFKLLYQFGKAR
ncbi:hypothetical protein [Telluribacter sp. SYSU D00476]|uniref:hypothetical protein n=1 Tax=Telluribacter sp. SYSU D00476 TaxID=2811430 RepID=UPI001FF52AFC|nr:hypothetical protein [Telluribacter sp. SYSU D00476]